MSVNILFIVIIVVCGIAGAFRGAIVSIGGLLSTILSFILSKALAVPVTKQIFEATNFNELINKAIEAVEQGIDQSAAGIGVSIPAIPSLNTVPITDAFSSMTNTLTGLFKINALHIGSTITGLVLFSIFMVIFGIIVHIINRFFAAIPMGKTINSIIGFACGAVKGIIISIMLYYLFICVNSLIGMNIPVGDGLSEVIKSIPYINF